MNPAKRRIVPFDGEMLGWLFRGRRDAALTSDWPEDAHIVSARWDMGKARLLLMVLSESFDEVPVGQEAIEWDPAFTAHLMEPTAQSLIGLIDKMHEEELDEAARKA